MRYECNSSTETLELGRELGLLAKPGDIYCLSGDLGAGKTVLAKGIALGLGIDGTITSPTFSILNEYEGRMKLYHFDVYRISHPDEMNEAGLFEFMDSGGLCVIEWAEMIRELLPEHAKWISIEKDYALGDDYRRITIE